MRFRVLLLAALATALLGSPAVAEPQSDAERLYAAGNFLAAASAAERDATSDSQAFAAGALLAACLTGASDSQMDDLLARAERAARAALDLNPSSIDARLQLAVVYGIRGRRASIPEAFRRGYAPRGRALIEEALLMAPNDARANALFGAWHMEVLRRAGRVGAIVYGARLQAGVSAFERARALAPNDPMIALHFAAALIEVDASNDSEAPMRLLQSAASASPRDALEAYAQRSAAELAHTLAHHGPRAAAAAALAMGL